MSILDSIKGVVWEKQDISNDSPNTKLVPSTSSTSILSPSNQSYSSPSSTAIDMSVNGKIYQGIAANTSEANCPNLKKYRDMVGLLRATIPDPLVLNKAALAASGVTVTDIIAEIAGLRAILKTESERATQKLSAAEENSICNEEAATLQRDVEEQTKQLAEKQQKLEGLHTSINAEKDKIKRKRIEFANAVIQRTNEFDSLEKEINTLR